MVVKLNFDKYVGRKLHQKWRITFNFKKNYCGINRIAAITYIVAFCFFIVYFPVKLTYLHKEIRLSTEQLGYNQKLLQKLSDKMRGSIVSQKKTTKFLLNGVPSLELLTILQNSKSDCPNIQIKNIRADRDILTVKCLSDSVNGQKKFKELLEKQKAFVSVTSSDADNNSGEAQQYNLTLTMKLNSMRYILENNPQLKAGSAQ